MESMKVVDKGKKWLVYSGPCIALYRGINLLVVLYDALRTLFLSRLLVSKLHTKSSSAVDYMNIV